MTSKEKIEYPQEKAPLSVIILTFNEEKNIERALESVVDWVRNVFVVDSYSTDNTLEIVRRYTDNIFQHDFKNYSIQRNWALNTLPIKTEWVLNLDSDHRVTKELKNELIYKFSQGIDNEIAGFLISRRTMFLGRWIKHGSHYPSYHNVLFRRGYGRCEDRLYDQHFIVDGKLERLNGDIEDIVTDSLGNFIIRHERWSTYEAMEQLSERHHMDETGRIKAKLFGNPIQRKRMLRNLYGEFPLFARSLLYFLYRYVIRLGFLDGKEGLIFHFLQGFWYRFLVDSKMYEIKKRMADEGKTLDQAVEELYGIKVNEIKTVSKSPENG